MKITLIGTGRMSSTLGRLWASHGHDLAVGSRDAARAAETAREIGAATSGSYAEALGFGEVVFLGVPWKVAEETVRMLGDFQGRILIDPTNPVTPEADTPLTGPDGESAAERLAAVAPGAFVVKAFNTIHYANLERPVIADRQIATFLAGDDRYAKDAVALLVREVGFDPVDCGTLVRARLLEPLALLWMQLYAAGQPATSGFAFPRERPERRRADEELAHGAID